MNNVNDIQPMQISTKGVVWPNEVTQVPPELFSSSPGFLMAGGFLVPTKSNGGIWYVNTSSADSLQTPPLMLTTEDPGWFYHRAVFADLTGDGKLDIVSCRANKPLIGSGQGQLVLLTQSDAESDHWTEIALSKGCDIFFAVEDLNGDGKLEIVAAEFFGKQLTLYWTENANGDWTDTASIHSRALDTDCGALFDIEIVDLNNDGKKDFLVTNHQETDANPAPSVFAYEMPSNIFTDNFVRHTLASGFVVLKSGPNQAAPGNAQTFFPTSPAPVNQKPWIALSGDGSEKAYIMQPNSSDPSDWAYTLTTLETTTNTIGKLAVADVNNDGYVEVFVPAYEANSIAVFTFAP